MATDRKKLLHDDRLTILDQSSSPPPGGNVMHRSSTPSWVHDGDMLAALGPEFADRADLPPEGATRRQFLQVMGASVALATTTGCFNQPQEEIVPFVRPPEQLVPGVPLYYATAMTLGGGSTGLLVETHMGRPTKVDGNPLHPAVPEMMPSTTDKSRLAAVRYGASDAFAQATVLSLYDPDRSQTILRAGQISTWDALFGELRAESERVAPRGGEGLRILTPPVLSPTLADQLGQLLTKYPNARMHQYEPINDDNALAGARVAFGQPVGTNYIGAPEVVLSLDADCFADGPMRLKIARQVRGQVPSATGTALPRLYVVETSSTITGAAADHRLAASPRELVAFTKSLVERIGRGNEAPPSGLHAWLEALATDLLNARGRSLVIVGRGQPPVVHAMAHWLNSALGNVGQTVEYRAPVELRPELNAASIRELARAMLGKEVQSLIILDGNPVYDAPSDVNFAEALAAVPFSLHLSNYVDETSSRTRWHVPKAHLFEAWGDTRAADGTATIVQPLIAPLYEGRTAHDVVAAMMGTPTVSSYDMIRAYWQKQFGAEGDAAAFDRNWRTALHDGVIANSASEVVSTTLTVGLLDTIGQQADELIGAEGNPALQITFRPDPSVWDGRFANSGWLQELPRPFTKLTWDNAALLSPRTASTNGIRTGDLVDIESGEATVTLPAFVVPGHPDSTLTMNLGYGRQSAGRVGNGVGTNVYPLRTSAAPWFAPVTGIRKTGRKVEFATTQHHHHMQGRDLVRAGTLAAYREEPEHPAFMQSHGHGAPDTSIYPPKEYDGYKWGMVINQSACIGCNACVVACQAENNIPVVGKDQVSHGREMQWLRIDNYYQDRVNEPGNPAVYHQPVMCQHCEMAPCEPVCPVGATTHSAEGLNEMTYNRCVGTRYCSNNCPYKVRRFNFFDYNTELRSDALLHLLPNPDVTIRSRGVMEKCTFCVQRINAGRIAADIDNRTIRDGEVVTACQAACPTQAIVFGDLNDESSAVRRLADSGLNYSLLGELNTRPRTTYLANVRNPNPELEKTQADQ